MSFKLGDHVRDFVSGFIGVVTLLPQEPTRFLPRGTHYRVTPERGRSQFIDGTRLEPLEAFERRCREYDRAAVRGNAPEPPAQCRQGAEAVD